MLKVSDTAFPSYMEIVFKIPNAVWEELRPKVRKFMNVTDKEYPEMLKREKETNIKFGLGDKDESS